MRHLILAALGLSLSSSALAFDAGLTVEMGRQVLRYDAIEPLFDKRASPTPTVTLSSDLNSMVTVQLGWQYTAFASVLNTNGTGDVTLFLSEHRLLPGIHLDIGHERFGPYVELNGVVGHSNLWMDDDPGRRTNPGQMKSRAFVFGAQPVGGVEFAAPFGPPRENRAVLIHAEMGWSFETDPTYDPVGELEHGARVFRGGVTLKL